MEQPNSSSQETGLEEITDAELIRAFVHDAQMDLHTAMPCKVVSVSGRTVTVEPAINRMVPDGSGNFVSERLPQLSDVPIADLVGGGMIFTLPVAAGDYGFLIFSERPIGAWRSTGNQGDPGDLGMHTLDGATYWPGLRPQSKTPANASGSNLVLGSDTNGSARLIIKSGEIDAGANATNFVAMANKVLTELNAVKAAFNTHTHTYTPGTATPAQTGSPSAAYNPNSVASSNLKAEG